MSKRSFDDKSGKNEWHPLFGLIGSVLWNELQSDVATLDELFTEETIAPVLWCDATLSGGQERHWNVSKPGHAIELGWLAGFNKMSKCWYT